MKTLRLIPTIVLPLALGALLTSAGAQGKGKGQGADKPTSGQGHGKSSAAKTAAPTSNGKASRGAAAQARGGPAVTAKQPGPPANRGQGSPAENAVGRGRAVGNGGGLPETASPRATAALSSNRGQAVSRFARDLHLNEVRPFARNLVMSDKPSQFMTGGAIAYGLARGAPENAFVVTPNGRQVAVRNRKGNLLFALDDDQAQRLGAWQVSPVLDQVKSGAPRFCRSGAGHPVWGRQWCLDKGFGLGADQDVRWGATGDIRDVIFGRSTSPTLGRDALLALLGPVVFDRLALHALTLGYTDPLTGVRRYDATGPDVLLINSGNRRVAELVDGNRDQRPDLMLVALRPW